MNPIAFTLGQTNNTTVCGGEILPRNAGGVNARALGSFDGQGLVGSEFDVLAFSS